jgi:dTDP-4-amino-4,6-dideoxygalactose transaminase
VTRPQFAEIPNGRGSRLDELQAAILAVRLDHLDEEIERGRTIAQSYDEALADLPLVRPSERPGCRHVYHLHVIHCRDRNALALHLGDSGIMIGRHYPFAVLQQPALAAAACGPLPAPACNYGANHSGDPHFAALPKPVDLSARAGREIGAFVLCKIVNSGCSRLSMI